MGKKEKKELTVMKFTTGDAEHFSILVHRDFEEALPVLAAMALTTTIKSKLEAGFSPKDILDMCGGILKSSIQVAGLMQENNEDNEEDTSLN